MNNKWKKLNLYDNFWNKTVVNVERVLYNEDPYPFIRDIENKVTSGDRIAILHTLISSNINRRITSSTS